MRVTAARRDRSEREHVAGERSDRSTRDARPRTTMSTSVVSTTRTSDAAAFGFHAATGSSTGRASSSRTATSASIASSLISGSGSWWLNFARSKSAVSRRAGLGARVEAQRAPARRTRTAPPRMARQARAAERVLHARVGGDDRAPQVRVVAQVVDRLVDRERHLLALRAEPPRARCALRAGGLRSSTTAVPPISTTTIAISSQRRRAFRTFLPASAAPPAPARSLPLRELLLEALRSRCSKPVCMRSVARVPTPASVA